MNHPEEFTKMTPNHIVKWVLKERQHSPSNAPSSPASPTSRSSTPSSRARRAGTWGTSLREAVPPTPMSCSTLPPTTPPARKQLVPFSTTSRTNARKMRPQMAATPRSTPPLKNKSGGGKGRSRPHQSSVDRGRQKTPMRPSSPPRTAKDLEGPSRWRRPIR